MAASEMNLPAGFELESTPNLPGGFELEAAGLPEGFELEAPRDVPLDLSPDGIKKMLSKHPAVQAAGQMKQAVTQGWERAGVGMVKSLVGLARMESEIGGTLRKKLWSGFGREQPTYSKNLDKALGGWAKDYGDAVEQYYTENADKAVQIEGETFTEQTLDVLTSPAKMIQLGLESFPLMLETALPGGIAVAATGIAGEVYDDARREGNDPAYALMRSIVTAVPEAAIEKWTFGKKVDLFKRMGKKQIKGLRKGLWEMGKAYFRGAAEEGSQELNRNFWRWAFTDRSQNILENVQQSAAVGGPLEMAFSGVSFGAGSAKANMTRPGKIARVEQFRDTLLQAETISPKQKAEVTATTEQVIQDVKDGVYDDYKTVDLNADHVIGMQFGLAPVDTDAMLAKAENRYRELKLKETEDLTRREKEELAWLSSAAPSPEGMRTTPQRQSIEAIIDDATSGKPVLRGVYQQAKPEVKSKKRLKAEAHKLARDAGLDDATYRELAETVTGKRSMSDMTHTQMKDFVNAVEDMTGIKNAEIQPEDYGTPVTVENKPTTVEAIMDEAVDTIKALPDTKAVPAVITAKSAKAPLFNRAMTWFAGQKNTPIWYLAKVLDGGNPNGVFTHVLNNNIQEGVRTQNAHQRAVTTELERSLKDAGVTSNDLAKMSVAANPRLHLLQAIFPDTKTDRVNIKLNDKTFEITPAQAIDLWLISNQKDGLRHLLGGGLVINGTETGPLDDLHIAQMRDMVDSNPKIKAVAETMLRVGEEIWKPSINNVSTRIEGKEIAVVDNWWGLEVQKPKTLAGKTKGFVVNLLENRGIFKDRTNSTLPLALRDALNRFVTFESAISEYVGMAEPTRLARTLLNNQPIAQEIERKGFGGTRDNIITILGRAQSTAQDSSWLGGWIMNNIGGMYRAVLHLNPRVVASMYSSVGNYGAFVSPQFMKQVAKESFKPDTIRETLQNSDVAWSRFFMGRSSLEFGEIAAQDATLQAWAGGLSDKNKLGWSIKLADLAALAGGTGIAKAELKAAQNGSLSGLSAEWWVDKNVDGLKEGDPGYSDLVTDRAEWLWQRTQPSWDKWSRSVVTTERGVGRLFFLFRSFHEQSLTILNDAVAEFKAKENKTPADVTRMAQRMGAVFASYTLNFAARAALAAVAYGKVEKPIDYLVDMLASFTALFPAMGKFLEINIRAFANAARGEPKEYRGEVLESFPIELVNEAAKSISIFSEAAAKLLVGDEEAALKRFKKATLDTFENVGTATGTVPGYEIRRLRKSGWFGPEEAIGDRSRGRRTR